MLLTKLRLGEVLQVPAGADLCRRQAYAIRITETYRAYTDLNGDTAFMVHGERLRVDGTPTRRKRKTITTFVRPEAAGRRRY